MPVRIVGPWQPTHREIAMAWNNQIPGLGSQVEKVELVGVGTFQVVGRGVDAPAFPKVCKVQAQICDLSTLSTDGAARI